MPSAWPREFSQTGEYPHDATVALIRNPQPVRFADCVHEVTEGIGDDWQKYRVLGATRAGLAPAKESVGKNPGRYKPVCQGTIF